MPSGLISTSSGSVSARSISAASLGNGAAESPWKERVQSIFSSGVVSSSRGLSNSPVLEMLGVVGCVGVGERIFATWGECCFWEFVGVTGGVGLLFVVVGVGAGLGGCCSCCRWEVVLRVLSWEWMGVFVRDRRVSAARRLRESDIFVSVQCWMLGLELALFWDAEVNRISDVTLMA